jgi:putative endonuclease
MPIPPPTPAPAPPPTPERHAGHRLGRLAEARAADWLEERGWRILARNWRAPPHEIDIVVRKGSTIAFVEVRARAAGALVPAAATLSRGKQRAVCLAARAWVHAHGAAGELYRMDLITVTALGAGRARLVHLPGAWLA